MKYNVVSPRTLGLFFVIITFGSAAYSQTVAPTPSPSPQTSSTHTLERDFFKNILNDQKHIWMAPLHLHRRHARWLAPIGFGTAALIATDRRTGDEVAESSGQLRLSRDISYIGSPYGVFGIAGAFYLTGRMTHNDRARESGLLGAEALIDSAIVVTAIKEVTQRSRPTAGRSRSHFFASGSSFPSGHSIQAWALATIVANEYHDKRAVQIAAYGLASAVSISRFTGQNHYLSDILVGSAMGYGIGRYVYKKRHVKPSASNGGQEESVDSRSKWPMIAPEYSRAARVYGAALSWSF